MAERQGKRTVQGMGAVDARPPERVSGVAFTEGRRSDTQKMLMGEPRHEDSTDDPRPLGMRDTMPAPPNTPAAVSESGARRRVTLQGLADAVSVPVAASVAPASAVRSPAAVSTPPPATRTSASPRGRYSSSQPDDDEFDASPSPPPSAPSSPSSSNKRGQRASREPLRVDAVGSTKMIAPHAAALSSKPRLVDRQRVSEAPLSTREAFVLALVDGGLTVRDLVDAASMPEREVSAILARLVNLGLVSLSS